MYVRLEAKLEEMRPGLASLVTVDGVGHYVSLMNAFTGFCVCSQLTIVTAASATGP